MNQIQLSEGLILLSGIKNLGGRTRFSLKLGNSIAQKEKVLYLSFDEYKEKLQLMLKQMDVKLNKNFEINSCLNEFCIETYLEILTLIEANNYSTIIINKLNTLLPDYRLMVGEFDFDFTLQTVIDSLLFIIRQFNCRIILVDELPMHKINLQILSESAKLSDIRFPRVLVNSCTQIFYLCYPAELGCIEDQDGNDISDRIELYNLKNENHEEELIILNNKELKIY